MLQNLRDNAQGIVAKIIIGLIVISFAFFGVESLIGGGASEVASVNGEEIPPAELNQAMLTERNRRMNMMGDNFDPALLSESALRDAALEQLIQQRLLLQVAEEEDIAVSDQVVDQAIVSMPQFHENGEFSPQLYQNILRSNGFTPSYFRKLLRTDLVIGQLSNGIAASEFVTDTELEAIAQVVGQKRTFKYLMIPMAMATSKVDVTEEEVKAYYDTNTDQFMTEERIKLEYIEIKQQDFFKSVPEAEIKAVYEQELAAPANSEERRAAHILVAVNDQRDKEQALEQAKALKAQLDSGEDFAALAKSASDDTGSSGSGGDLGYTRGDTFPPAFETALFALPPGGVSEPVLTDAGYHLIKVTEIKAEEKPSYEDRKPVIEQQLMLSASRSAFVSAVEELKDLVFNSEDLKVPAREVGLTVSTSDWLSRQSATGVLNNAKVLNAAFSEEVLQEGNNSEVIELKEDHFIVVNVIAHDLPHKKELAEVEATIREQLVQAETTQYAKELAENTVAAVKAGEALDKVAEGLGTTWNEQESVSRTAMSVNRELLTAVFALPRPQGEALTEAVTLASGDVAVVMLSAVTPGDLKEFSKAEQLGIRAEMQRGQRGASTNNFMTSLRERAEIEVF